MKKRFLFIVAFMLVMCFSVKNTDIDAGVKVINAAWTFYEVKPNQVFTIRIDNVKASKLKWRSDSSDLKILKGGKFKVTSKNGFGFLTTEYKGIEYNIMISAYKNGGKSCADLHTKYRELEKENKELQKGYEEMVDKVLELEQERDDLKTLLDEYL